MYIESREFCPFLEKGVGNLRLNFFSHFFFNFEQVVLTLGRSSVVFALCLPLVTSNETSGWVVEGGNQEAYTGEII